MPLNPLAMIQPVIV
jgi:hypothetical protein